jgi:hypothetical protein
MARRRRARKVVEERLAKAIPSAGLDARSFGPGSQEYKRMIKVLARSLSAAERDEVAPLAETSAKVP